MKEGLTAWRILSDYPHYKLVTDYADDLRQVRTNESAWFVFVVVVRCCRGDTLNMTDLRRLSSLKVLQILLMKSIKLEPMVFGFLYVYRCGKVP